MKKLITLALFLTIALVAAPKADIDGAKKGVWTMDYDSVLKATQNENTPILMLFTGSDWCGWCKVLDEKVLSKTEWIDYAQKNLYLAYIDFPRDGKLVPEKYKKRNRELQEKFAVRGYPTILLLDAKGNKIGSIPMERNFTPNRFITKVRQLLESSAK
ncbi:MAG: thioredoxin fold domain-containing protein [Lentisphaerae bacterium]|nr:thioredoxin fold domain-containing protein [Lentisphaerota bacterium]